MRARIRGAFICYAKDSRAHFAVRELRYLNGIVGMKYSVSHVECRVIVSDMGYDYDNLYGEIPDALGAPTLILQDHFKDLEQGRLRVLDVGCGQGRDALFIARLEHSVVGVDLSFNGIRDLTAAAHARAYRLRASSLILQISNRLVRSIFYCSIEPCIC
jgi:2-polyprenyl-3-methyl-5-hydroxy-6-metoxy-1,4-benzoquinol methylase